MLQDMDYVEAGCVLYVKVGRLDQVEQSNICVSTVILLGIGILTWHHDLIVSI